MFCTNCGKELHVGDKFCSECGTKVREEKVSTQEHKYIPSFKEEAERKSAEISQAIAEEQRLNKSESSASVSFDWNLDGFPSTQPRKTEEIDFNWSSVVEKKSRVRETEVVSPFAPMKKPAAEAPKEDVIDFAAAERKQAEEEAKKIEAEKAEVERLEAERVEAEIKAAPLDEIEEDVMSIEELEKELFKTEEVQEKCVRQDDYKKNTAQLEKFYTYNQKNEEFQQLLDQEYERLKGLESESRPVINTFFEMDPVKKEIAEETSIVEEKESVLDSVLEIKEVMHEAVEDADEKENAAEENIVEETETVEPELEEVPETVTSATIDFSAIREEARSKKRAEAAAMVIELNEELEVVAEEPAAVDEEPADVAEEQQVEAIEEPAEAVSGEDSETVLEEETQKAEEGKAEEEKAEVEAAEVEKSDEAKTEAEEVLVEAESDAAEVEEPEVETAEIDAAEVKDTEKVETEEAAVEEEATGEEKETEAEESAESAEKLETEPEKAEEKEPEKIKLRYSDIFPREDVEEAVEKASKSEKKTLASMDELLADDEDDEEKSTAGGIVIKLVIGLLVVLIVVEAALLGIKFIAPESNLAIKADELINSVIAVFTGENEGENEITATEQRISEVINETEKPDSIGQIEHNMSLKYDMSKETSFKDIKTSAAFTDSVWRDDVTYCDEIIGTVVSHYGKWIDKNEDESLIGINTLEIGEIRIGEKGYYVLHRLTFAAADGQEKEQICTAFVKISDDNMEIDEVKEEVL